MCGLIAGFNTSPKPETKLEKVNDYIVNQFEDQISRGEKGFGIIRIDKSLKIEVDRACETTKFLLDLYCKESSMIIAHHRTPTSTDNKLAQTHPMFISDPQLDHDYLIVHNGIVSNDTELHKKHNDLGFVYSTEYQTYSSYSYHYPESSNVLRTKYNDSEAIAIEMALFIEGKEKIIGTESSAALIALQINKKTNKAEKVYFGRSGASSCLNMNKTRGKIRISSEGEGDEIKENILYSFSLKDKAMTLTKKPFPFKVREPLPSPYPTQQSLLPATTDLTKPIESALTVDKEKEEVTSKRMWVGQPTDPVGFTDITEDEEFLPSLIEKDYVERKTREFSNTVNSDKMDAQEISNAISDQLDEESTNIEGIINDYKRILLSNKIEDKSLSFYMGQIYRVIKAMKQITDEGEQQYLERSLIEASEEDETERKTAEDIAYGINSNFGDYPGYDDERGAPYRRHNSVFNKDHDIH